MAQEFPLLVSGAAELASFLPVSSKRTDMFFLLYTATFLFCWLITRKLRLEVLLAVVVALD
jgi:hypothetical protein